MTNIDWNVLNVEGVQSVVRQAALGVSRNPKYRHAVEFEDLQQDALIMVASTQYLLDAVYVEESLGILHTRLVSDLINSVATRAGHADRAVSYDALLEGHSE